MVTNTLIPYALVKEAGNYVDKTVKTVQEYMKEKNITDPTQVPKDVMLAAIDKYVTPFFQEKGIIMAEPKKEYYSLNAKMNKNVFTSSTEDVKKTMTGLGSKL